MINNSKIIKIFFIITVNMFAFTIHLNNSFSLDFNLKEYTKQFTQITNLNRIKNFAKSIQEEVQDKLTVENLKAISQEIKSHPFFVYIPKESAKSYSEKFPHPKNFKISIPTSLHYITDRNSDNYLQSILDANFNDNPNDQSKESTYSNYIKAEDRLTKSSSEMNDLDIGSSEYEEPEEFNPFKVSAENIKNYVVILTDFGDLFIELYDISPLSVEHFLQLMKDSIYLNGSFYRYIPNYIIQGGDQTESGLGGNSTVLIDEFSQSYSFERGTVALSNNGNTNSSDTQFFITFYPATWLNGKYNIIGKVVLGLDNFEYNFNGTYQNNGNLDDVIPINNIITLEEFLQIHQESSYNF